MRRELVSQKVIFKGEITLKKRVNLNWVIAGIVVLIIVVGYIIFYIQYEKTTYGKALGKMMSSDEEVQKIVIRDCNLEKDEENDKTMVIKNNDEITKIIEQPANMTLNRTSQEDQLSYIIEFQTDKANYMIKTNDNNALYTVGEKPVRTPNNYYEIIGKNKLLEAIESNKEKWETIDKSAGSLESGTLNKSCPKR